MPAPAPRLAFLPLCVALALLSPASALANDTAMGGWGSDLVPLSSAKIRMKAEDILIRAVDEDWEVEAQYTFENLGKRPVALQVGFPEYACEGGGPDDEHMCNPKALRFESMRTSVDGQPVTQRRGTIKKAHPWAPRLGQVWLFDVSFAPRRETIVTHRYRVAQGAISDGTALGLYITRTGASWAGTIGHARFRIHVPVSTRSLFVKAGGPDGDRNAPLQVSTGLSLTTHVAEVGGKPIGEIVLEARDWEPKVDVHFGFFDRRGPLVMATYELVESDANKALSTNQRCPNIIAMWAVGGARAEPNPGDDIAPTDPTEADVERFVKEGLGNAEICRGYVYSMYGKRFDDDAMNRYFYGPAGWKPKAWPYGAMQPNPGYADSMLTPGDRATLQLIARVEARLAAPPVQASPVPALETSAKAEAKAEAKHGGCSVQYPGASAR